MTFPAPPPAEPPAADALVDAVRQAIPGATGIGLHVERGELRGCEIAVAAAEFDDDPCYAYPGPALAAALEALGWSVDDGVDAAVWDDVDRVGLRPTAADPGGHPAAARLWHLAEAAARALDPEVAAAGGTGWSVHDIGLA